MVDALSNMTLWPHVWAIPFTFLAGAVVGWLVRAAVDEAHKGGGNRKPPRDAEKCAEE